MHAHLLDKKVMNTRTTSSTSAIANLVKLLPTGTVFLFEFLNPVASNNGKCHHSNKILSAALITLCGLSCVFSTFTDSYTTKGGDTRYGIVTTRGLVTFGEEGPSDEDDEAEKKDEKYRLKLGDFVHAALAAVVFGAVVLLDSNTVRCFFPGLESSENTLLAVLPTAVGVVAGSIFSMFPSSRHGLGYIRVAATSSGKKSDSNINNKINEGGDGENGHKTGPEKV